MSTIAIAGAGVGGLVAAQKLALAGHDVTVYERNREKECGHEQKDSFDATAMDFAGIDIPNGYIAPGNDITFYPLDESIEPITAPSPENYKNITVDRKVLFAYLKGLAQVAGAKFLFETEIISPVMLGGRVAGIKTSRGDFYADLVIDSCGIDSPLRTQLPEYTAIDHEIGFCDFITAYRAFFERVECDENTGERYKIYLNSDTGFSWIITEENCVDVLIVDFEDIPFAKVADRLHKLSLRNPQMGKDLIKGGKFTRIPVREPLAVLVSDGYAAIGDSAFMTYAVKGSGIAYSIKAAAILARAVEKDENRLFDAENLWEYQKDFYKEVGFDACRIALLKNLMPYFTADEINEIFARRLVTSQELDMLLEGNIPISKIPGMLKEKIKLLGDMPEFKAQLMTLIGWFGKFTVVEPFMPNKYSREDADKWRDRYNKFFDSVKNSHENIAQAVEKAEDKKEKKEKKAAQAIEKAEEKKARKEEKAAQAEEKKAKKEEKKKGSDDGEETRPLPALTD